jgi:agmatinase
VPVPFIAGFADHGSVWILEIDAHIDWRDKLHGERYGYSNTMRRASEMPHVAGILQVGIRSVGSARLTEIAAARHYGSRFVTAREVHTQGVEAALRLDPRRSTGRRHPRLRRSRSRSAGRGRACAWRPHLHAGDRSDRGPR